MATAEPNDLRNMAEAWGEEFFPAPPEDERAKDAAAADVLRRAAVPHLLACADEIENLRMALTLCRDAFANKVQNDAVLAVDRDLLRVCDHALGRAQ